MANRHLSRSIVMQTLYEWDFREGKLTDLEIEESLARNAEEFAPGVNDISFMRKLLLGILEKRTKLDDIIEKAAPDWPIEKIALVDRNILRMGLYELLFEDRTQVPAKVAINEAIELAKSFGGETSGKFVNGVLGAVYKELGEPGKEETSKKKSKAEPVDPKTLPVDKLGGAVVYARDGGDIYLGLVHDIFGHWTLSKGHYVEGEDDRAAITRIVNEEIGLPVTPSDLLGENEYVASHPEKGKLLKKVKYFLAEAPYQEITLKKVGGGLDDARWWKLAEILDLNLYDDMIPVITKAVDILLKK
ncbi:MAG: transcription antitermination factor NusB [Candidatus Yonathbacteria bacterium RIFOXYC2_FULL_47_9]|nr:MAG: transcription antitermination factor NusB [Candidatus Yonathbacteria bacterium RIFOXYC2_FULL_47_9]HAT68822.1 transcription antitermination factor NusB [Candidatus Yonathbacteria bacterium]